MENTKFKILIFKILPKGFISRIFGYTSLIPLPQGLMKKIIAWYSVKYGVNLAEAEIPAEGFKNLNKFFTRTLKSGSRKIDEDKKSVVAATDSRVDQYGDITDDNILQAKGVDYSLRDLIPSIEAEKFINGKYITLYLSPGDYHRIHSPVSGKITGFFNIPGKLYTVQEFMVKGFKGLFAVNERLITYIETDNGAVAVCKIGAINVGKISLSYDHSVTNKFFRNKNEKIYDEDKMPQVKKGDEIGIFNLGSTVIILFEEGMVKFNDLKDGQMVKMGEKIGTLLR
ncbi:MAG TPA: archaetidylserine decarboxylase [Spirochaetota bacterium]|nr:archaetidylserine decarboxylase [Spirochaetota bacterium]HPS86884.1 archaetidylserine decarboxylase [Spirochaetota bacterium]